jgi:BirA family biotin operon repressor/biotin-[acetyl-CoA-carboxylase] ligase
MAEAGESVAGCTGRRDVLLKWPNDLVVQTGTGIRKLAGLLGETDGLGTDDPRVVIGIGVNGDWPVDRFPTALAGTMTSLRALAGDRAIDHAHLLDTFLLRLEPRIEALRDGRFDVAEWTGRQVTTGREVELIAPDGSATTVRAHGVDPSTGALLVEDAVATSGERAVLVGEIRHVRLTTPAPARV